MHDAAAPRRMQQSLFELNRRFLDLVTARDYQHCAHSASREIRACLARMTLVQLDAIAACPYALFDLRFQDEAHWQARLRDAPRWQIADADDAQVAIDFVRLALFYAWHVAHAATLAARVQLGMSEAVVVAFRQATLDRLPALAGSEAAHLDVKWSGNGAYWELLTRAAAAENAEALRRVQLYGLQLTAAVRLYSPHAAGGELQRTPARV